jgi:serine protease Do
MKQLSIIIAFIISVPGFPQKISDLYTLHRDAVVIIKIKKDEVLGQGYLKSLMRMEDVGSGFVISEQGDIITSAHLVQTAEEILIIFSDGEEIPAKVIYSYPMADVALLKLTTLKSTPLAKVSFGDSDALNIGDQVFVIGAPYGLGNSLSVGYVSGKYKREHEASGLVTTEVFQTDAAINQGSSGAPIFNMEGKVVGIASFILSKSQGFQGIGFAATSNIAKNFLIKEPTKWTGINGFLVYGYFAEILNLPQPGGVLIQKVVSNSLGDELGLKGGQYLITIQGEEIILGGDIILSLEGIPLINEDNVIKAWHILQGLKSGDHIKFTILRKGNRMVINTKAL